MPIYNCQCDNNFWREELHKHFCKPSVKVYSIRVPYVEEQDRILKEGWQSTVEYKTGTGL